MVNNPRCLILSDPRTAGEYDVEGGTVGNSQPGLDATLIHYS